MKSFGSAVVSSEVSAMAWERVVGAHPERADELTLLWDEIRRAMSFVLTDPETYAELMRRVRARNLEMERELELI
jgi:hypothetical protein